MKKITIPYFPAGMKYVGAPLLIGLGIYLGFMGYPVWIAPGILLSLVILTTRYVTEINLERNQIRDYVAVLGLPLNVSHTRFNALNRIIIKKEIHSQVLHTRAQTRQMDWDAFTGILVMDGDKTLDLLSTNNREELLSGLKPFAEFLKVDIEDQSTGRHYLVDIHRIP